MDKVQTGIDTATLFRMAEIRAEGVIAVLRMIVALGLGVPFVVVIWQQGENVTPVLIWQWTYAGATMVAYFALGLVLWLAHRRRRLRHWMVWLAATGDCLFLLFAVWTSLMNTGLSGGHLFLFPAVWLAPLVLAFGVLRFNPLVQAYVAVVVVAGLTALFRSGPQATDSMDIELMLSTPPNVMRLAMLALAGVVLVVATIRTRDLVLRSITEAGRTANLNRYLPAQLAGRLAAGGLEELRRGRRQQMGVLFIDMRGFTSWSQTRSPPEIGAFVSEYRSRISAVAAETGGMIDKFVGDAAMILFDRGGDTQAAARACVTCAEQLHRQIADWSRARVQAGDSPVQVGIGLHWGELFSGVVGDSHRLEYSVFGDTVNAAARLEELTKSQGLCIIASRDILTQASLGESPEGWQALEPTQLRGRSGALEILGRAPVRTFGPVCPRSKTGVSGAVSYGSEKADIRMKTMLEISVRKVAQVALMARELERAEGELRAFVDRMNEDEQAELVAIMWIGRESFFAEDLAEAIATARAEASTPCADYLIGTPHLSDHLENGLDALGISAADAEDGLM